MKYAEKILQSTTVIVALLLSCGAQSVPSTAPSTQPAPNASATTPTAPTKGVPQAKSQEEFAAYQAAAGVTDLAASQTAIDGFADKYPQSELRTVLYTQLLQKYYNANQSDNIIATGKKILAIQPQNTVALIMVSTALAESTRDSDLDRDQKYAESIQDAQTAIKTIDTGLVAPPTLTPEQLAGEKRTLISMANSALGYVEMNRKNFGLSEDYFKQAVANQNQPDPANYLRLAVSQDNQKKYAEALDNIDKAISTAQAQNNPQIEGIAKNEKDRLTKLASSSPAPKTAAPPPQAK